MLATLTEPIKVTLPTNTTTRGQIRQHITTLDLTTHARSILGHTYAQLLADPDITQLNTNLPSLQYNYTKGLAGRSSDRMAWVTTLLAHIDVFWAYEEGMQEQEPEEPLPTQTNKQSHDENTMSPNSPYIKLDNLPLNNAKDKMPPTERHLPGPLKQMRRKQGTYAKILTVQNKQRARVLG